MQEDVNIFLDALENNYDEFDGLFNFNAKEFLADAHNILESNTLPVLDMPFSALDYLALRSK